MVTLPTVNDLEKLPLRALVAYASRAARRLCSVFRGDPTEATVKNALSLAEAVVSAEPIADVDIECLIGSAAEVVAVLGTVREDIEKYQAAFGFNAARTAWEVVIIASGSCSTVRLAAKAADAAARAAELLDEPQVTCAIEDTHRDYVALLKRFGEQTNIVIGEAFKLPGMDGMEDLSEGSSGDGKNSPK